MHGNNNSIFTGKSRKYVSFENNIRKWVLFYFSFLFFRTTSFVSPRSFARGTSRLFTLDRFDEGGDTREVHNGVDDQNESRLERFRFDGIKFDSGRAIERHFFATPSFESQLVTTDRSSTNYVRSKFRQQDRGSNLLTRAGSKSFLDFSLDILPISLRVNTFFLEGKISLWRMRMRSTLVSVSRDIRATRLYSLIQLRIDLHRSNAISKLNFDDG